MQATKDHYKVIGLMSGTSLDGLDMAYCEFTYNRGKWDFQINSTTTKPYTHEWQNLLANIITVDGFELTNTDILLGKWMGEAVYNFMQENNIAPDFIASHGHTVFHQPEKGIILQIGNGFALNHYAGVPVINSFRNQDVLLGGQGAPLVPIGDRFLFGEYAACLNLGGIANISAETQKGRIAYDICPVNMVLNHLAGYLKHTYDPEGSFASSGKIDEDLLHQLDQLGYYHQPYPKSLGYEWVDTNIFPLIKNSVLNPKDLLATFTHHMARKIAMTFQELSVSEMKDNRILVTGGGAFNNYLLDCIRDYADENIKLMIPEKEIIAYKEAMVFALLGTLRARNEVNCLSSVTGCAHDHSGGLIYGDI